ncbi:hypothetical protein L227DRAFT_521286 [Lentinus tigrinus ALCF2SS1-6]|uniref:DNA-directed RNA polymerase III subunit RPC6 n=1 Tax=Lentinus tigrinus ALCF2SS1-6 TaxID=1328759 RepID=A0A5C2SLH1_9APHY|nr:hypothetical protein L227DRAFT_521286 [Lentinus tigrinus ALCF2SS1-6]
MSGRKLNSLERNLYQHAMMKPDKVVSQQDLGLLAPDASTRLDALNFLLGTGLFVALESKGHGLSYRAVTSDELKQKKGLSQEEGLVLDHIRAAGNEGIWTKHIKVKTQLHQAVVDKCLKSLTQKQLIRTVTDVRYATRKIYMLAGIEPSAALTGGPWFTDKELDTDFIKLLMDVCLKIVRDQSLPQSGDDRDPQKRQLYPLSRSLYPSSQQILRLLQKSRITETQLTVEHVEMLLDVLVLDGKIENIPAFHLAETAFAEGSEDEHADASHSTHGRKRSKRKRSESSSDDSSDGDRRRKRHKDESTDERSGRKKSRKSRRTASDERSTPVDEDGDESDSRPKHRLSDSERKPSKGKAKQRSPSTSSDDMSDSDTDYRSHRDSKSSRKTLDRGRDRLGECDTYPASMSRDSSGITRGVVYRAVHEERLRGLGLEEAPCIQCPTYDFCRSGGPVNPQDCFYYEGWLVQGEGA